MAKTTLVTWEDYLQGVIPRKRPAYLRGMKKFKMRGKISKTY